MGEFLILQVLSKLLSFLSTTELILDTHMYKSAYPSVRPERVISIFVPDIV